MLHTLRYIAYTYHLYDAYMYIYTWANTFWVKSTCPACSFDGDAGEDQSSSTLSEDQVMCGFDWDLWQLKKSLSPDHSRHAG